LRSITFVNKASCVHNIWYTGNSITTTEHSAGLRPFLPLLAVWKTKRKIWKITSRLNKQYNPRGLCNYRGATNRQTPDKRQALKLALETNHNRMAVIQEAGLET